MTEEQAVSAVAGYKLLYPRMFGLVKAIQDREGWYPGSRSYRNKNPGNLKEGVGSFGDDSDGFARFEGYFHGLYALCRDLFRKCTGYTTTSLGPDSNLRDLVNVYAPGADGNDVDGYVGFLVASLDKPETTRLGWFLED